jgi:hypothetical protein
MTTFGSFGRKHKSFGSNYGKKDTSKFKKGLIAGGLILAGGAGIYASKGDKETHQEVEYPLVASEAGEGLGHNPALVEKLQVVGVDVGKVSAPPPAIDLSQAEAALAPPKAKKEKIAAGLKLAGEVVAGDVGKVKAVKKGIDIARGEGEAASTKSLEEQIKAAEKNAKKDKTKISRESVGVGVAPMIGPVAPPEFFDDVETKKNKKQQVAGFFAKPFKRG